MHQSNAVAYLLVHFAERVKSNRRNTILAGKTMRMRGLRPYSSIHAQSGYVFALNSFKNREKEFIEYLGQFVSNKKVQAGVLCHCAEIVVGEIDYSDSDLVLLMILGKTFGFTEEKINNILHVVLCRESLCSLEADDMFKD